MTYTHGIIATKTQTWFLTLKIVYVGNHDRQRSSARLLMIMSTIKTVTSLISHRGVAGWLLTVLLYLIYLLSPRLPPFPAPASLSSRDIGERPGILNANHYFPGSPLTPIAPSSASIFCRVIKCSRLSSPIAGIICAKPRTKADRS